MKIEDKIKKLEKLGKFNTVAVVRLYLQQGKRAKAHYVANKNMRGD